MEDKKTAGRQKIPIEKLQDETKRKVAFSKRLSSLYKNASKIVRACNVDIGIVSSCPSGRTQYSYVHPTTTVVIDHFVNPTMELDLGTRLVAENERNIAIENNIRLNELDAREAAEKEKIRSLEQMNNARKKCWWESIDQIDAKNLTTFETKLNFAEGILKDQLKKLIETLSSSEAPLPPENEDS
uniref:MADS-box domain-containing protein n=1 Tax=Solanum lycopersicum TaxID=4081 RepID=A0A3Q7G5A9_SOLLC|nr:agamous-like MADS-box protein AGL29 [Solanum lycopersicum]